MRSEPPARATVRFGAYELDLQTHELRKNGRKLKLREQPLQVLAVLIERPGELVTREELQKRLWSEDTFVDFDNSLNTAVARLREVLGDSARRPRFIETIPRRGYRFVAQATVPGETSPRPDDRPPKRTWLALVCFALAFAVAVSVVWLVTQRGSVSPSATVYDVLPLTTAPGSETQPSLSPDGRQVAYSWIREGEETSDIYVQMIDSGEPLRRTTDAANDYSPAWSPDGTKIAFLRRPGAGRPEIRIMPALRGPEQELAEVAIPMPIFAGPQPITQMLAWHPSGEYLAIADASEEGTSCIFLLSLKTKRRQQLTHPPRQTDWGDVGPAFSPDGRRLVFARYLSMTVADLFLLELSEDLQPDGEPQRLTSHNSRVAAPVWTTDGKNVLFSSRGAGSLCLWKLPVAKGGVPHRIAHVGEGGSWPTISSGIDRLVYERRKHDIDIWRVEVDNKERAVGPPEKLISSTRTDTNPRYSPDGERIAFRSDRSGNPEIWVCHRDGSNWVQLTRFGGQQTGTAAWSPDGKTIAFTSWRRGTGDVYVVDADGGEQRQLTASTFQDQNPEWSPDGKWIYFGSNRSGERQIWRMPTSGGEAVRVTTDGTMAPFRLSADGRFIYFPQGEYREAELWRSPAEGGQKERILDSLYGHGHFALSGDGIYFIPAPDAENRWYLHFLDLTTGQKRRIVELRNGPHAGLSTSPDGRHVLYTQSYERTSDLMLVEDFR